MQNADNLKLDTYSEPTQRFKMEHFAKLVKSLTIFPKRSMLDLWQGYEYAHLSLHAFFKSNSFISNARLKLAKKIKQMLSSTLRFKFCHLEMVILSILSLHVLVQ